MKHKRLSIKEIKAIGDQDAELLITEYVNGKEGFFTKKSGHVIIGDDAAERLLFANLYLMLRDLSKSGDKNACNSDQSSDNGNDQ